MNKKITEMPQWRTSHPPWLVAFSVMLATFMSVLNTSVANVSLSHIAGSLSASTDEATWVLTSYMAALAIVLAATGWLCTYFGRKNYLLFSVLLFTVASAACGMAQTLPQLILARIAQGIGGGGLQPLAQAIMMENFPHEKRGAAMAAYGTGIVVAPIIGPIFGGWITDNYSWRWVFYINVPIGIISFFLQKVFVEDPPYLVRDRSKSIDYAGLVLMIMAIATLQVVLDKGQELDWFASHWICLGAAVVLAALPLFVWREVNLREPFINLRLLKHVNLAVGTLLGTLMNCVLYATTSMLPMFMQRLLKYPAMQSGMAMMPRGVGSLCGMIIAGRLVNRMDKRLLIAIGFMSVGISCTVFSHLDMDIAQRNIFLPQLLNGLGSGLIFVPMTVMAMSALRQHELNQGTGIFNFWRNVGSSIGISVIFAYQTRMAQVHQVSLVSNITSYTPAFRQWAGHLESSGASPALTYALAYVKVQQQASMLAFVDCFRNMALLSFFCVGLAFLLRVKKKQVEDVVVAPLDGESFEDI
jgi:DHA2 family multidrug resistance protein